MMSAESEVRSAAAALHAAIVAANAEGLVVTWPARAADLPAIAISETGRSKATGNVGALAVEVNPFGFDPQSVPVGFPAARPPAKRR